MSTTNPENLRLIDFQHPDLCWRVAPVEVGRSARGLIFNAQGRFFEVYARAWSSAGIHLWGGPEWKCTRFYSKTLQFANGYVMKAKGSVCDYSPGVEHTPPMPGQRCYSCGKRRAAWVVGAPNVMKREWIYGDGWQALGFVFRSARKER